MNYELSEDQETIRRTARELLEARVPAERLRRALEESGHDEALWTELRGLGWAGIAVAEEHGGQGLGMIELAVICEELGRALAPVPLIPTGAAAIALSVADSNAQSRELLGGLVSGEIVAGVGSLLAQDAGLCALPHGAEVAVLLGEDRAVLTRSGGATALATIDPLRSYARLGAEGGEELPGGAARAADMVDLIFAAELTGVAQRALELAVAHAGSRSQFGRPIGGFQGVAHRCARMMLETEKSRSLVLYAAWTADQAPDRLALPASSAKIAAGRAAISVTSSALQVLGAIGFTWESDIHLLLKRARLSAQLARSTAVHRRRAAALRLREAGLAVQRRAERRVTLDGALR